MSIQDTVRILYTIGHSNLNFDQFFRLLDEHGIQCVIDVRSQPYSRYVPHFNREGFRAEVERRGLTYEYKGDTLGGRPQAVDANGPTEAPDYEAMAKCPSLLETLEELVGRASETRFALVCSEGDPSQCHRTKLLGRVIESQFRAQVVHITADGTVTQSELHPEQLKLL